MLSHQLATPLAAERERFAEVAAWPLEQVSEVIAGCGCDSFGDLLRHETPCIEAIRLVKEFAKASLAAEGDLPRDVARVLYVLAILRGRGSDAEQLTSLDNASIERETRRCLTFGWLPDNVRDLIRSRLLRSNAGHSSLD